MARVKLSSFIRYIRGGLGDVIFRRHGKRVIMSSKPTPSDIPPTKAQLKVRERFRRAAAYGKRIFKDPSQRADYERVARKKGKPIRSVMVSDYLRPPTVEEIDASAYAGAPGNVITVIARDNVEVASVTVALKNVEGETIENGEAACPGPEWVYEATKAVPSGSTVRVIVTATDRPGGTHTEEIEVQV